MKNIQNAEAFPIDIFYLIIDDLGYQAEDGDVDNDPSVQALHSCALVSQAFHMCARRYLAVLDIVIDSLDFDVRLRKLIAALKSSIDYPGLGMVYYLKSVSFTIRHQVFDYPSEADNLFRKTFPDILEALHGPNYGISSFGLHAQVENFPWLEFQSQDWFDINPRFTKAFHALCCSPKMNTLYVERFTNVPRDILCGSHIEHLNLPFIQFAVEQTDTSQQKDAPENTLRAVQLRSLRTSTHCMLPDLLSVLQAGTTSTMQLASCMSLVFANLTDLTITTKASNTGYHLSLMPQLRALHLIDSCLYGVTPDQVAFSFHNFFSISANYALPDSLRHLTMQSKASLGAFFVTFKPSEPWDFLDLYFSRETFANVEDIHLQMCIGTNAEIVRGPIPNEEEFLVEYKEFILQYLPHLVEARPTTFILNLGIGFDEFRDSKDNYEERPESA